MIAKVIESQVRLVRGFTEDGAEIIFDATPGRMNVEIVRDGIDIEVFHLSSDAWDALVSDVNVIRHIARRAMDTAQVDAQIGTQVDEVSDVDAQEPEDLFPLAYGPSDGA